MKPLAAILVGACLLLFAETTLAQTTQEKESGHPSVVKMIGPVLQNSDLRALPYIPPSEKEETDRRLMRHPRMKDQDLGASDPPLPVRDSPPSTSMPAPLTTFDGMSSVESGCNCLPPDPNGDVGPNHYIESVNSSIRIYDKNGNPLTAPTTYNSFFAALGSSTPCGRGQNDGDGVVFYDHIANRWVVTDFAFTSFPGPDFCECIGVSQTDDPVSGGWYLYSVRVDPDHPNYLGDYPKFGVWPDAYYMSTNLFSNFTTFNGVRVYALDRNSMINGGPANAIGFTIDPPNLGDEYSLLPATFRAGSPPPAGQPEWFMSINSPAAPGVPQTQVFVRQFHADFGTPANSTFGVGAGHTPNGIITVNPFVEAWTFTTNIVPNGTGIATQFLDALGDKLMYPLVYQNLNGTESIWATHTVNNNQNGTGPTAIRWYQFNVTGNTIPAAPLQQQTFNNGGDGLWRWMPSLNVDAGGNLAIGYSASSLTLNPEIRYAGRRASNPVNTLAQGEAVMYSSTGHQTHPSGRWGDYTSTFVDPSDGLTFYHTNEYYSVVPTSGAPWKTRVGTFKIPIPPCPQKQGYWKNNVSAWPVTSLMLGTVSYNQAQLLAILNMPVKADASLILANQLIAAKLNVAAGADAFAPVPSTISSADDAIAGNSIPMNVKPNTPLGRTMTSLSSTLEDYNSSVFNTDCTTPAKIAQAADGEAGKTVPEDFALNQNYPNPFNPVTTIEYALPVDARVSLEVFDVLGERVVELVSGQVAAGYHAAAFDASNLASGIYFYRLSADDGSGKTFTQLRKLVLMK